MLVESSFVCSKEAFTGLPNALQQTYTQTREWMLNVVAEPSPEIPRPGGICPFVRRAHDAGAIYYVEYDASNVDLNQFFDDICQITDFYQQHVQQLKPEIQDLFSVIIVVTHLHTDKYEQFIDAVHYSSRLHFMQRGLMLGEFHPRSRKPSARNDEFFPLVSPVPCFAVRKLTGHDILFINNEGDTVNKRREELELYIEKNGFTGAKAQAFRRKLADLHNLESDLIQAERGKGSITSAESCPHAQAKSLEEVD